MTRPHFYVRTWTVDMVVFELKCLFIFIIKVKIISVWQTCHAESAEKSKCDTVTSSFRTWISHLDQHLMLFLQVQCLSNTVTATVSTRIFFQIKKSSKFLKLDWVKNCFWKCQNGYFKCEIAKSRFSPTVKILHFEIFQKPKISWFLQNGPWPSSTSFIIFSGLSIIYDAGST